MNQPDPRMSEADRRELMSTARKVLKREDGNIEKIALRLALEAFTLVKDMPAKDMRLALYLHAEALRKAAELVEERVRMAEGKGRT